MKKENLTKNEAKEKVIKTSKTMDRVMGILIWTLVIVFVLAFIIGFLSIATNNYPELVKFQDGVNQVMAKIDTISQKRIEFNKNNGMVVLMKFICGMSTFLAIGQILKNTIKNETPFIEKNIKNIKEICSYQIMLCILGEVSILTVFTIWVLYYIFRYGYTLQIESDETL